MTRRRSRREIREAVEQLEQDTDAGEGAALPELSLAQKEALDDALDVDPFTDDDGPTDALLDAVDDTDR